MENKVNKLYGLLYGSIVADTIAVPYKKKENDRIKKKDFMNDDEVFENVEYWSTSSDLLLITLETITDAIKKNQPCMNCFDYVYKIDEWNRIGLLGFFEKDKHISSQLNFVIKQEKFMVNPIYNSKHSYNLMGKEITTNEALTCNSICGVQNQWYKNTILHSIIISYDSRCIASCIVNSYVIHCLYKERIIDWTLINKVAHNFITNHHINKTTNLIEFSTHWHIAFNYKKSINKCKQRIEDGENPIIMFNVYADYLNQLNIGKYDVNENQNYTLLGMILSIIIIFDMEFIFPYLKEEEYVLYYKRRIIDTVNMGGDTTANCSIIGAIIGIYIGYESLPKEWIDKLCDSVELKNRIDTSIKILLLNQ